MNPFWWGVLAGAIGFGAIVGVALWLVGAVNVWFVEQDK